LPFFHAPSEFVGRDTKVAPKNSGNQPASHGLDGLLNVMGYFVELNDDATLARPFSQAPLARAAAHPFPGLEMMVLAASLSTYIVHIRGRAESSSPRDKT